MTFKDALSLVAALFLSVGGAGAIILLFARWLGDILSQSLLEKYKNTHERELEQLKSKYQTELEKTKTELEKTKVLFLRYSEKQFELYTNLWKILLVTKQQADDLWSNPLPEKIPAFSEQIRITKNAVQESTLLIEESHYKKLKELFKEFEQFRFGKLKLIDIKSPSPQITQGLGITEKDTRATIKTNKKVKDRYERLVAQIESQFRKQITG
jgi:hypothetical protein